MLEVFSRVGTVLSDRIQPRQEVRYQRVGENRIRAAIGDPGRQLSGRLVETNEEDGCESGGDEVVAEVAWVFVDSSGDGFEDVAENEED